MGPTTYLNQQRDLSNLLHHSTRETTLFLKANKGSGNQKQHKKTSVPIFILDPISSAAIMFHVLEQQSSKNQRDRNPGNHVGRHQNLHNTINMAVFWINFTALRQIVQSLLFAKPFHFPGQCYLVVEYVYGNDHQRLSYHALFFNGKSIRPLDFSYQDNIPCLVLN